MTFNFVDNLPDTLQLEPILISGNDSINLNNQAYLILELTDNQKICLKIKYEFHCSPFKDVTIIENILAVGHEEYFYLFDLKTNLNILSLKMAGYFGHLYFENDFFYVSDACGLYCIAKDSSILWKNRSLGIDGVIINNFSDDNIFGSGECDPPGGWVDFILDKQTGRIKK